MTAAATTFSDFCYTAANESIKIPHTILNILDRLKGDTNAFANLLTFTASGMDLVQRAKNITSFNPAIRVFGSVGAIYNAAQIGGTIHYLFERVVALKNGDTFFNKDNSFTDFVTEVSFGVANFGSAVIWANDHNLIDLGKYTIKSIGGVAVSLTGAITAGAVSGFASLAICSIAKLNEGNLTKDQKIHHVCNIAWTVSEIALMVIPAVGLAPAAPWIMITGTMFAKAAGMSAFIYR